MITFDQGMSGVKQIDNDSGAVCELCHKSPEELYPMQTTDGAQMVVCWSDLRKELRREKLKNRSQANSQAQHRDRTAGADQEDDEEAINGPVINSRL